ncbi:MAG: TolC family protein [Prevotella sp.]|nr:TolC family protein [Prevotella sp.]
MKRTACWICCVALAAVVHGQTLQECQQAAERNYPLIRQYDLISKTTELTVANIGRTWLPQVAASAQATYQTDVTAFPESMQAIYRQAGISMEGLKKDQYRVGIDVQQTVFDGGTTRRQKTIAQRQGALQEAQTEVTMYQVRRRVNELFFGLLLLDEQLQLNADLQELLSANEKKLLSMYQRGTAAESDYKSVKAERLHAVQQSTALQSQKRTLTLMLGALCGMEIGNLAKPAAISVGAAVGRPELKTIDAQLRLADAQEKALSAALKPRLSVFAQGVYGYPGLNLFEDMMNRRWSLGAVVGARLTWNIGALYTHKNDMAKIQLQRDMAQTSRDVFLFNNNLEQIQQHESIERYRKLMADDAEIIALRSSVRKAAESKLAHGIIDVNDLLKEINAENGACVQQSVHEIEMLKEIYDLQYTTNSAF